MNKFMEAAIPIGAVIVYEGKIIGRGITGARRRGALFYMGRWMRWKTQGVNLASVKLHSDDEKVY